MYYYLANRTFFIIFFCIETSHIAFIKLEICLEISFLAFLATALRNNDYSLITFTFSAAGIVQLSCRSLPGFVFFFFNLNTISHTSLILQGITDIEIMNFNDKVD